MSRVADVPGGDVSSTASVAPAEAFDFWRHMISTTFVPLTAEPTTQAQFRGQIRHLQLGQVSMSTVTAHGQHVRRTRSLIARSDEEYLLASIQLRGRGRIEQDDQVAELGVGSMACYDSTRPYTLHFDDEFEQLVVQVPLPALTEAAGLSRGTRSLTAHRLDADGVGKVVGDFFVSLARAGARDPAGAAPLLPHAMGLLGTALLAAHPAAEAAPALARERVAALIRQRHADAALDVNAIAAACHMSRRTLYRLFDSGDGVADYLRRVRVERAKALLRGQPDRLVSSIALDCGFREESQFYRVFRAVTGTTPGEYRRRQAGTPRQ